jgi:hypothetical protein
MAKTFEMPSLQRTKYLGARICPVLSPCDPPSWELSLAAIVFFGMEGHARRHLIPFFFPNGEPSLTDGTKKLSISRRILAFPGWEA